MKITAALLAEKLQKRLPRVSYERIAGRPPLGCPLLYEQGGRISQGHFYVAEEENFREAEFYGGDVCPVLICRDGGRSFIEELPYIRVETEEGVFRVLNEIQEIFQELEEWKMDLEKIRNEGGVLLDYLTASQPVFGNPLCVLGTDFSMKAESGLDRMPAEARVTTGEFVNMEYVNMLKQDETYNEMQEKREVCLYPGYTTGYSFYNLNLWENGQCRYRLMVHQYDRPLTEGDRYLMECLAPYVQYCVYHKENPSQERSNTISAIFQKLLTDRTSDYMEISRQLEGFGWGADCEYFCLVFQTTYLDRKNFTANAICSYMENTYPGTCSFVFKEDIVTYFNLALTGAGMEELEGKLKYFIRESFLKAGYSRVMQGHGNLRRQYVQADIALDVGSRTNPYLWIHHFNDVAFSYILEQSSRRLPGYMICHEKLLRLMRVDEQQNTEYMKTLRVYLDENLNAMQSAKKLFIHRSTFLYRLEKIKAVLESDLNDPEELLYLGFSFRILDKENSKKDQCYKV